MKETYFSGPLSQTYNSREVSHSPLDEDVLCRGSMGSIKEKEKEKENKVSNEIIIIVTFIIIFTFIVTSSLSAVAAANNVHMYGRQWQHQGIIFYGRGQRRKREHLEGHGTN